MSVPLNIFSYETIESTQDEVVRQIKENVYKDGSIIQAQCQTKGRGRKSYNWFSSMGTLMFSYGVKRTSKPSVLNYCNRVCQVLHNAGVNAFVKWPNDVYFQNKKVCGIIVDIVKEYEVVGIGINLYGTEYPSIQSMTNILIDKMHFLSLYFSIRNIESFIKIPEYIKFSGSTLKVKKVDDTLVLETEDRKTIKIAPDKYSYDIIKNEIKKIIQ